jgi:hypothetical protein
VEACLKALSSAHALAARVLADQPFILSTLRDAATESRLALVDSAAARERPLADLAKEVEAARKEVFAAEDALHEATSELRKLAREESVPTSEKTQAQDSKRSAEKQIQV